MSSIASDVNFIIARVNPEDSLYAAAESIWERHKGKGYRQFVLLPRVRSTFMNTYSKKIQTAAILLISAVNKIKSETLSKNKAITSSDFLKKVDETVKTDVGHSDTTLAFVETIRSEYSIMDFLEEGKLNEVMEKFNTNADQISKEKLNEFMDDTEKNIKIKAKIRIDLKTFEEIKG